jgi:hypothetical protein
MLKSEIQRKMEYISLGADMYEAGWKNNYKSDYIKQSCDFLRTTPQAMRIKNPVYYKDIVARAGEAADMKWEEEKLLIAKWEDQRRTILESARMA